MRYVALAVPDLLHWTIIFPEIPGVTVVASPLRTALNMAKTELLKRATVLTSLGLHLQAPMAVSDLVVMPEFKYALPFIIAVPDPRAPGDNNVVRFLL